MLLFSNQTAFCINRRPIQRRRSGEKASLKASRSYQNMAPQDELSFLGNRLSQF